MQTKQTVETGVYAVVIILCLITMLLVASSGDQFKDTKIVYQAF